MSHTLRLGILGAARINRRVVPACRASRNAEIVAIASREKSKAEAAAKQHGIPEAVEGYQALLDRDDLDAVYVPLANHLHAEWCLRAIERGKHVLCEKPLALSAADVARVESAARAKGVVVMEAFVHRFHPQQYRVLQRIASGEIGTPKVLRGSFGFVLAQEGYNIRLDPEVGGGATWDVGCYPVNLARWFFGEPSTVYAEGSFSRGVDLSAAVMLDFPDDRRALLDYGLTYGRRCGYEIIGTKGSIAVETMWQEPDVPALLHVRGEMGGLSTEELPKMNHFQGEIEAFAEAVLSGIAAPYPLEDSQKNVAVCEAILRSMRRGERISLDDRNHH